jgi:hypothetical protein
VSTIAIDTPSNRSTERLTAFLSEIGSEKPIDQYFPKRKALEVFTKKMKVKDAGRQVVYPLNSGANPTVKDASDYDSYDPSASNTALIVTYPMVNKIASLVISWEEEREVAGKDHAMYDLIAHKRDVLLNSVLDAQCTDLFAATQNASKISSLVPSILATGALGGLNQSTDSDWASTVTSGGSFAAQGMSDMLTTYGTVVNDGAEPDVIITTLAVNNYYHIAVDPDVRYAYTPDMVAGRGWRGLEFMGAKIVHDKKCTNGVMYFITSDDTFMSVDSAGNYDFPPFIEMPLQRAKISKFAFRGNLIFQRRKSNAKITGITA